MLDDAQDINGFGCGCAADPASGLWDQAGLSACRGHCWRSGRGRTWALKCAAGRRSAQNKCARNSGHFQGVGPFALLRRRRRKNLAARQDGKAHEVVNPTIYLYGGLCCPDYPCACGNALGKVHSVAPRIFFLLAIQIEQRHSPIPFTGMPALLSRNHGKKLHRLQRHHPFPQSIQIYLEARSFLLQEQNQAALQSFPV